MKPPSILWLRQDLRLDDQPALAAAAGEGPVVAVYILDDVTPGRWAMGGAQRWWLHHSLTALGKSLEERGTNLLLRRGETAIELARLAAEIGTRRVHATQHYEPWWRERERQVAATLELVLHSGDVLVPPEVVRTGSGSAYKVYTPYWRALQEHFPPAAPCPAPARLQCTGRTFASDDLTGWGLLPTKPDWAAGFDTLWVPGEAEAQDRLRRFGEIVGRYEQQRDRPGGETTSLFSPHLHFGELSPRRVWHALPASAGEKFRQELAWRDFSRNVAITQPRLGEAAGRPEFERFPWRTGTTAEADFNAWSRGLTGYPIVDAGMRQLWSTGWMHNRVRMIAASFLVKHLLLDWRRGAAWFWDTLVDADYGNNSQNWQWIAGTGIDSQPFNRIMAPIAQSLKFDAAGYIRQWLPELAALDDAAIHEPGDDRPDSYPPPIIGHRDARERALNALNGFTSRRGQGA